MPRATRTKRARSRLFVAALLVAVVTATASGAISTRRGVHEVRGRHACGLWPQQFTLCAVTTDGTMYRLDELALPDNTAAPVDTDRLLSSLPKLPDTVALRLTAADMLAAVEIDAYTYVTQLDRQDSAWSCADEACGFASPDEGGGDVELVLDSARVPADTRILVVSTLVEQPDLRVAPRSWALRL